MGAKLESKRQKLIHRRDRDGASKPRNNAPAAASGIVDSPANQPPSPPNGGAETPAADVDALVSDLREHTLQGRIFEARAVVRELRHLEGADPTLSPKLDPVRHLLEETLSHSDHVESLLRELHSDDGWTLARERAGVTVHSRKRPDSPIHTVRAATTFRDFSPKDFVRLVSLFNETEHMHQWFPMGVMRPAKLLSWPAKYEKVIQLNIDLSLPMIASRDAIVLGSGYHLPDRNAVIISTKAIEGEACRHCAIPPPARGVVRMSTESIFYMELTSRDVVSFKMIETDDLKLKYMPSAITNALAQGALPFELMRTIRRTLRHEFEGSVWEEKIRERGDYYAEIEEKIHEQLEKWEEGTSGKVDDRVEMDDPIGAKGNRGQGGVRTGESLGTAPRQRSCNDGTPGVANGTQMDQQHTIRSLVFAILALIALSIYRTGFECLPESCAVLVIPLIVAYWDLKRAYGELKRATPEQPITEGNGKTAGFGDGGGRDLRANEMPETEVDAFEEETPPRRVAATASTEDTEISSLPDLSQSKSVELSMNPFERVKPSTRQKWGKVKTGLRDIGRVATSPIVSKRKRN
ncbi:hypothetical protein ACHAWF_010533 [Thalassiosira exigua]